LFSIACIMYYLLALESNKEPFILAQFNRSCPNAHSGEISLLNSRLNQKLAFVESELQEILRQILNTSAPNMRGSLGQLVQRQWFQDPLLKTLRYLENIDFKENAQKVQFLQGLVKVIDKFEKKILIEKIIPLLMQSMSKDTQISVNVLPIVIQQLQAKSAMTSTQFRERVWPSIIELCGQRELPAQALYLLLKNQELIVNFVSTQEFGEVFLPLITKSLACGVPKLQVLALNKVKSIFSTMDY